MKEEPKVDKELARQVVSYCIRHPDAAGDLEDFVRWRLLEQRVHHQLSETKKALDWLVTQGLLARSLGSSVPIFKLNPEHRTEAERFAAEVDGTPGPGSGVGEA